jgi:DNA-cytosine methyltransferase
MTSSKKETHIMRPIKVLSLFDGIGTGRLALHNLGIPVHTYYTSEIDPYAIRIASHHFPDTHQLSPIEGILPSPTCDIDLVMGGSPCQGFSIAGKGLNFNHPQSKLFFDFVDLVDKIKPKYVLLENVKMRKEWVDIITNYMGLEPVLINSSHFSAQDRKRYYWTNIPFDKTMPECLDIVEDILEDSVDVKYVTDITRTVKILDHEVSRKKIAYIGTDSQGNRIYKIHNKSVTLCGMSGGLGAKTGLYALPCLTPDRVEKRQNGRRFKPPGSKFYTLTALDKHGILTDHFIRKLTPLECERLQTFPPNYTALSGISDNQRYRMLGNSWTLKVIEHILKGLKL